jgi:hypothetical protein
MGSWPKGVPHPPAPEKPEGITEEEWQVYLNSDQRSMNRVFRDKVETAMGWKEADVAEAQEIADTFAGAIRKADGAKGHVPEENLFRYRNLMRISRNLKSLGDTIGPNDMTDSTILWRMAKKYRDKAQELRADIPREEG